MTAPDLSLYEDKMVLSFTPNEDDLIGFVIMFKHENGTLISISECNGMD